MSQPCTKSEEIAEIKQTVSEFKTVANSISVMKDDLSEIKHGLLGTPYTEDKGLIHVVSENKEEIKKLKDKYYSDRNWLLGAAAGIALIISIVYKILF